MPRSQRLPIFGTLKSSLFVRNLCNFNGPVQKSTKVAAALLLVSAALFVHASLIYGQVTHAKPRTSTASTPLPDQATATDPANRLRGKDEFGAVLAVAGKPTG